MPPSRHRDLVVLILLCAMPAYANNPPAPDGIFSLLLIFIVAVAAMRLAGVPRPPQARWKVVLRFFVLFLAFFFTLGGTEIAAIPLLIILVYGVYRGLQIMHKGQGGKRFALGLVVIAVTGAAIGDYMLSLNALNRPYKESYAIYALREIASAESKFKESRAVDADRNGVGEFGNFEQLVAAKLLDGDSGRDLARSNGYRYQVLLAGEAAANEKQFVAYALPVQYSAAPPGWTVVVPGGSYFSMRKHGITQHSYAIDASGVIRRADLGGDRSTVTREEIARWQPLF